MAKQKMKGVKRKVGKYELGRTIGEGNFAKVKFAQNTERGENVAIKILAKTTILKHKMVDQVNTQMVLLLRFLLFMPFVISCIRENLQWLRMFKLLSLTDAAVKGIICALSLISCFPLKNNKSNVVVFDF